jgi:hypothetical protein
VPIRPENRARYPRDWPEISRRIRFERAKGKCEKCGAPHGVTVLRSACGAVYILPDGKTYHAEGGVYLGMTRGSELPAGRFVKIILTVAHLDHTPENCADDNLLALCQLHHLRHDQREHQQNAARTRRAKLAAGDLFEVAR